MPVPDAALQNGGGIRNDPEIPAGNITELTTLSMVPFPNFVSGRRTGRHRRNHRLPGPGRRPQYPYRGAPFTSVGVTYQQALANYIVDALVGSITAADYPEGGEGRNIELP